MMKSSVCVDASFVVKLVVYESDSQVADALWQVWQSDGTTLYAPALLAYEAASSIRKRVKRGLLTPTTGDAALTTLLQLLRSIVLIDPVSLMESAWTIAKHYSLTVIYDASYVALAVQQDVDLWTGDGRMLRSMPQHAGRIKTLNPLT